MQSIRSCALSLTLLAACMAGSGQPAPAAPPLNSLVPFERVDADPRKSYSLAEHHGPWLIMVTTFQGAKAEENGKALALELRKTHKLHAYTHRMTVDNSANMAGRGFDRSGNQPRMRNKQGGKIEEVAVLVGDFNGVEDPQVKDTLKLIKGLRPQTLSQLKSQEDSFDNLRDSVLPEHMRRKTQGPLRLAFVTTNPLLPEGYYQPKGIDQVVANMNHGVQYSLLDCRDRYTIKVATFSGNVVIDPKRIQEIKEEGKQMESRLIKAAEKAHEVTIFLRAKGFEAYEYHDRHSSIVTVGSYASPGQVNPDGGIIYSAEVQEKIDRFRAKPRRQPNGAMGPVLPEVIESLKIYLDPNPIVIEVPRRSYGSDYARSMTGGR